MLSLVIDSGQFEEVFLADPLTYHQNITPFGAQKKARHPGMPSHVPHLSRLAHAAMRTL